MQTRRGLVSGPLNLFKNKGPAANRTSYLTAASWYSIVKKANKKSLSYVGWQMLSAKQRGSSLRGPQKVLRFRLKTKVLALMQGPTNTPRKIKRTRLKCKKILKGTI